MFYQETLLSLRLDEHSPQLGEAEQQHQLDLQHSEVSSVKVNNNNDDDDDDGRGGGGDSD